MSVVQRVLVGGITGAGKSTFAQQLAMSLGLPYHEMDAMYHGPNWQPIPTFVQDVEAVAEQPAWVLDSHGYTQVRDLLWQAADTVVWLDYSRPLVLRRVLSRSARRAWMGEPIFNGNTERFVNWFDSEHPIAWSMSQYRRRHDDMSARFADPQFRPLRRVRLSNPAAAELWLRVVQQEATGSRQFP